MEEKAKMTPNPKSAMALREPFPFGDDLIERTALLHSDTDPRKTHHPGRLVFPV